MRICPRCTRILEEAKVGGVTLEGCHGCGGAWFDAGELTEVARRDPAMLVTIDQEFSPSRTPSAGGDRLMTCPACRRRMEPFEFKHFPGVAARGCPNCKGVWMDDGELTKVAGRLAERRGKGEKQ